ncbi:MAG TPA: hybrid sensor histidine kinase/response regulator [Gammaproteobacteria bacterium]|nr:hybrid sensor histidine kinase/response regulator [Gammaproteobacteria bacterium]
MSERDSPLADHSMLELFRMEVDQHTAVLTDGLLRLEEGPAGAEQIEPLMRAAHSVKGAARLVGIRDAVELAHLMEDVLVAAQKGERVLEPGVIDVMLRGVDMLILVAELSEHPGGQLSAAQQTEYQSLLEDLRAIMAGRLPEGRRGEADERPASPDAAAQPAPAGEAEKAGPVVAPPARLASFGDAAAAAAMLAVFRDEVARSRSVLMQGLATWQSPPSREFVAPLLHAARAVKGAARLLGLGDAQALAQQLEALFSAAKQGAELAARTLEQMVAAVDFIDRIAQAGGGAHLSREEQERYIALCQALSDGGGRGAVSAADKPVGPESPSAAAPAPAAGGGAEDSPPADREGAPVPAAHRPKAEQEAAGRVLRISAGQLNRLMGLAGESMVEARWLRPYAESLIRLKRRQLELVTLLDALRESLDGELDRDRLHRLLREVQGRAADCRHILADRLAELESYDRRAVNLSSRLHREVVASRMRPFGDGVQGFPRMVRDVARSLNKQVQLQIDGQSTLVDRDILDKIEAPLNHLLRNAVDHGMEPPQEREAAGKPARGTIRLSAYHQAGMFSVVVEDDGRGVDLDKLRRKVIERGLVSEDMGARLTTAELMEFLFLPNFSTRDQVTEISGRGVGLDVVHDVVQEMRGMVRATSEPGKGTRFQLQLPLTLSVIPALLVEIGGEPYAFPLARIERILQVPAGAVREMEGYQYISVADHHIGLVAASQVLGVADGAGRREELSVVVLGERKSSYGVVVDRFLGERDLVVHVLPPQLGKIKDISSAALMEDGAPLLIVDVDDLLRSIEKMVGVTRLERVAGGPDSGRHTSRKRILIVDDSITVREVERKLLEGCGYQVNVAVDGIDGWNALHEGKFDLVITDIDMPRMDGIELVRTIRKDAQFARLPVMIVSYKDREEDRLRGLEAGADYYLTKGSFHDETLKEAVVELIGMAA